MNALTSQNNSVNSATSASDGTLSSSGINSSLINTHPQWWLTESNCDKKYFDKKGKLTWVGEIQLRREVGFKYIVPLLSLSRGRGFNDWPIPIIPNDGTSCNAGLLQMLNGATEKNVKNVSEDFKMILESQSAGPSDPNSNSYPNKKVETYVIQNSHTGNIELVQNEVVTLEDSDSDCDSDNCDLEIPIAHPFLAQGDPSWRWEAITNLMKSTFPSRKKLIVPMPWVEDYTWDFEMPDPSKQLNDESGDTYWDWEKKCHVKRRYFIPKKRVETQTHENFDQHTNDNDKRKTEIIDNNKSCHENESPGGKRFKKEEEERT